MFDWHDSDSLALRDHYFILENFGMHNFFNQLRKKTPSVKAPERVRFWHENVRLSASHGSDLLTRRGLIGWEVYIFNPKIVHFQEL